MREIQNLLNQVSIITKKNSEFLDATGGRFNMFRMLGVDHYENTHSAILAELLNPKGSHGLKELFLEAFIDIQIKKDPLGIEEFACRFDYRNAKVYTEYATHDGRIDILIEDSKGHAIIIENKIYAGDQWEQLKRYDKFARDKYRGKENYQIFYLTLNGKKASGNSGEGVNYIQISHSECIIDWLEKCVSLASRHPLVRETIIQYINHLKKLTNQDMDTKNKEEIVKILSSSEQNIQAAFSIFENANALKEYIISNYFNPQIHEIAKEFEIKVLKELHGSENYIAFSFEVPDWKYFRIKFEFDASDWMKLGYMYSLKDPNEMPIETISTLHPKFSRHNLNKSIPCGWSNMSRFCNWDIDAFLAIRTGEMKNEIKRVVANMIEQAKDLEM